MRVAIVIVLLLASYALKGQALRSLNTIFPAKLRERTQLDSSINVNKLSLESCYQLIEKAFTVDQQYRDSLRDRKSTRLNSSHSTLSRMPSSA